MERRFQIFREGQVIDGTIDLVKKGDMFQVFEEDGSQFYWGRHFLFKAISDPFEQSLGNRVVNFEEVCN